jgi:tungstate transport system ATP-binding protein
MNIIIKNAQKEYNKKIVLDVDSLCFEEGRSYALLGLNGSGKSTLLQCVSGLEEFTHGEVSFDGEAFSEAIKKRISVMLQKPYMFNGTAGDNITMGLKFRNFSKDEIKKRVEKYIKCFDIEELIKKNARKLSGGEQAKIALLRTAVLESDVTFLDEPTASMDIESTLRAEELIKSMAHNGRTVVLVTHDLFQAERIADYVIFLDKGRVIEKGEKNRVFNNPENKYIRQILKRGEMVD